MAVYQIVEVPNPILKARAKEVANINAGVLRVLDNMRDTLYAAAGVGLAAPQIGISKRMVVIDIDGESYMELINPEIIEREGEQFGPEACLSVPGMQGMVRRSKKVTVKALNREGEEFTVTGEDLLARAFQHEIDHLNGIVYTELAERLDQREE